MEGSGRAAHRAVNPYRSPAALANRAEQPAPGLPLAQRSARLAASTIDHLSLLVAAGPALALVFSPWSASTPALIDNRLGRAVLLGGGLALLAVVQTALVVRYGQTIGKRAMRIRVVDHVGDAHTGFVRAVTVRFFANLALAAVPLYYLVDALFIFGSERRCLHDLIAGTKVVETNA